MEEQEKAALNEDRKVNLMEVLVTEVTDEGKFYGCTMSEGPALEKLMDSLREEFTTNPPLAGAYQPKKNDICAAKFVDEQWYRAKIEKTGATDAQVFETRHTCQSNPILLFLRFCTLTTAIAPPCPRPSWVLCPPVSTHPGGTPSCTTSPWSGSHPTRR